MSGTAVIDPGWADAVGRGRTCVSPAALIVAGVSLFPAGLERVRPLRRCARRSSTSWGRRRARCWISTPAAARWAWRRCRAAPRRPSSSSATAPRCRPSAATCARRGRRTAATDHRRRRAERAAQARGHAKHAVLLGLPRSPLHQGDGGRPGRAVGRRPADRLRGGDRRARPAAPFARARSAACS